MLQQEWSVISNEGIENKLKVKVFFKKKYMPGFKLKSHFKIYPQSKTLLVLYLYWSSEWSQTVRSHYRIHVSLDFSH